MDQIFPQTILRAKDCAAPGITVTSADELLAKNSLDGEMYLWKIKDKVTPDLTPRVYCIRNTLIVGPEAAPLTNRGEILRDSFIHEEVNEQIGFAHTALTSGKKPLMLKGEYLPLCGKWNENLWHWVMENIPTIIMAENSGFLGTYIVRDGCAFILETFDLLGIPKERVITWSGGLAEVSTLYIPKRIVGWWLWQFKDLVLSMREALLAGAGLDETGNPGIRLYISRNLSAQKRRVVNEEEVLAALQEFDFKLVHTETMTLTQQLKLMASANTLIGPHGAGMTHTLFIRKKSLVIEFFSPVYINPTMLPAIDFLQHRYHMLPSYHFTEQYQHGHDIQVCVPLLQLFLRLGLSGECERAL